eukprot:scaffold1499_cov255-Pinguiococcus_pyrenoidosus.AAC.44
MADITTRGMQPAHKALTPSREPIVVSARTTLTSFDSNPVANLVFTTSRGVVQNDEMPPASAPAARSAGVFDASGFRSNAAFSSSKVTKRITADGTLRHSTAEKPA